MTPSQIGLKDEADQLVRKAGTAVCIGVTIDDELRVMTVDEAINYYFGSSN